MPRHSRRKKGSKKRRPSKRPNNHENTAEMEKAVQAVIVRVERDYERNGQWLTRIQCLERLLIPNRVKRAVLMSGALPSALRRSPKVSTRKRF